MYLAEKQARSEIEERIKIQKSQRYKEHLQQEQLMREAALKARHEKAQLLHSATEATDQEDSIELNLKDRNDIRYLRKREVQRQKRIEDHLNAKTNKHNPDLNRDISEKVALG